MTESTEAAMDTNSFCAFESIEGGRSGGLSQFSSRVQNVVRRSAS